MPPISDNKIEDKKEVKEENSSVLGKISGIITDKKSDNVAVPPLPSPVSAPARPQVDALPALNPPSAVPPLPKIDALPVPPAPPSKTSITTPPALPPIAKTDIETKQLPNIAPPALPAPSAATGGATTNSVDLRIVYNDTETDVPLSMTAKLDEIAEQLNKNKSARVTITAYASGTESSGVYPKRVSLARGIAVRNYLTGSKNIEIDRVNVKALGNKNDAPPYDRVDININK